MVIKVTVDISEELLNLGNKKLNNSNKFSNEDVDVEVGENNSNNTTINNNLDERMVNLENTVEKLSNLVDKLGGLMEKSIIENNDLKSDMDKVFNDKFNSLEDRLMSAVDSKLSNSHMDETKLFEVVKEVIDKEFKKKEKDMMMDLQNQMNQMSQMNQMNLMNLVSQFGQMNPNQMNQNQMNQNQMNQNQMGMYPLNQLEKESLEVEKTEEKRKAPKKEVRSKLSSMMDI